MRIQAIQHPRLDRIIHHDRIDSTNTEARRMCEKWAGSNVLLVAEEQTGGRGRLQRPWHSPPGTGLWFTLFLGRTGEIDRFSSLLSLYAAVIVCDIIRQVSQPAPQVKWPNDVLINGLKVAGILTETTWQGDSLQAIILGVGMNVSTPGEQFPPELQALATSLSHWSAGQIDRSVLLKDFLDHFFAEYSMLQDPVTLTRRWESLCGHIDQDLTVVHTGIEMNGKFLGITAEGQARLFNRDGVTHIAEGEITNPY